jgi:NAD(P)-dependent dehydrogenase (short-subunit alcohol dehydrogenase family)
MGRFENKVAVITGAAGGIGAATARKLASEGARVVVADINGDGAEQVAKALGNDGFAAVPVTVDVEHEDQIAAMFDVAVKEFGGIDVLHNNAALTAPDVMARDGQVTEIDADIWDRELRTNLRGYALGAKHAIPRMLERGGGAIVNTSSGTGIQAEFTRTAYATSKAGVIGLTRNIATQYGHRGIRCNCIAPGLIMTSTLKANLPPEILQRFARHFLTPYLGEPEDIANAVAFLASQDARFITGITLSVDGGVSMHTPMYVDEMELLGGG